MGGLKYFLLMAFTLIFTACQNSQITSGLLGNSSNGSSGVPSGRTQIIQATANDPNGVTKVEFYVNSALTCTSTSAPYNCSWNVPVGAGIAYQLQTKAYDAQGKVGSSQLVSVTSQ